MNKIQTSILIIVIICMAYLLGFFFQNSFDISFELESMQSLRDWINEQGWYAEIIFFLIVTFRIFIGLSSHTVLIIGGLAFGMIGGTILGAMGLVCSAFIQFYVAKKLGGDWVKQKITSRFNEFKEKNIPNSKILHCSRNSKDNCLSLFKNSFASAMMNESFTAGFSL